MTTPDPYPADPTRKDRERTHTTGNRSSHDTEARGDDAGGDAGGRSQPGKSERPGGNVETDRNGKTYEGNTGVSGETAEDVGA